jgi:hypothetical protein
MKFEIGGRLTCHQSAALKAAQKAWDGGAVYPYGRVGIVTPAGELKLDKKN